MCFDDMVFSTANHMHFVESLQVGTNGYFSFGTRQTVYTPSLFSSTSTPNYLVAPFWADIDITVHGSISYEVHSTSAGSSSIALLNRVSTFISNQKNTQFFGNWMLVATWSQVSQVGGSSYVVSFLHGHRYVQSYCRSVSYPESACSWSSHWGLYYTGFGYSTSSYVLITTQWRWKHIMTGPARPRARDYVWTLCCWVRTSATSP